MNSERCPPEPSCLAASCELTAESYFKFFSAVTKSKWTGSAASQN
jgi:hypothetical protein